MSHAPTPFAGLRILLVEADYVIATETERWLRAAGAAVIGPAAGIEQALDPIERRAGRPERSPPKWTPVRRVSAR